METTEVQAKQQAELEKSLWAAASDLRGNMDASEYRNYILGMIFYRFLSQEVEDVVKVDLENDHISFEKAYQDPEYATELREDVIEELGYFIEPGNLFDALVKDINQGDFDIEKLQNAVNSVQDSTIGRASEEDFKGLFDDMNLTSTRLGNTVAQRSELMAKLITNLSSIDFKKSDLEIDVLGNAYEYLIGQFAASAGKKAGEFYTPQQVSKLLARIVTADKEQLQSVYDPTMGSGSLLLQLGRYTQVGDYYGQEINRTTYNLARMNLLMHRVSYDRFELHQGDTLEEDFFEGQRFDAVVANPPYSAHWSTDGKLDDERFRKYGSTSPKSKADFAFVEHMLYHLDDNGTMAVVLPHGVLFRGAAEGKIRKFMIENDNVLDTVIGLPANLFYGTSIPTVVLVFKKNRSNKDIFFIDASSEFEKGKNQNNLTDENVDKIVQTYLDRKDVDKYAHDAEFDEIEENEFNLNIPRYVDTFEEEEPIEINQVMNDLADIDEQIARAKKEFEELASQLVWTDEAKKDGDSNEK